MKPRIWCCLVMTAALLAGCRPEEQAPASPTPIPFQDELYEPTPFPDQTGVPLPPVDPEPQLPYSSGDVPTGAQAPAPSKSTGSTAGKGQVYQPGPAEMHEALEDYGAWHETPEYGQVWRPRGVQASWRPYEDGRWVNSDEGWLWEAREPWGWLPYHYGSWVSYPSYGWVWVPGTEWAPSRVVWRANDQYVAWAPIPPTPRVDVTVIPPAHWIVVPAPRFLEVQLRPHIVPVVRAPEVVIALPPLLTVRPSRVIYYPGPDIVVVRRWMPVVPPPVRVVTWRYEVPVRYKRHYDRGYHRGWYKPVHAPPPPRNTRYMMEMDRKGPPPGHMKVDVDHHGRGHGKKEVEVDRYGRAGHTEVEVDHKGRGRSEVEIEREGRRGRELEVEVDRRGRGRSEVEIERESPRRRGEVEVERKGRKVEVEVEGGRPARRIESGKHDKHDKNH